MMGLALGLAVTGCAPAGDQSAPSGAAQILSTPDNHGYHGSWLDQPYAKPDLSFTDTAGKPFDLARDTHKPVTLVFFGYTSCPDVCNTVLADAASAIRRAGPKVGGQVQLVFITTDPKRDTPSVIRDYLDRFDPRFVGLTAGLPMIKEAADSLDVALTGEAPTAGGGYDVGHGAQVIGFGPDGKGRLIWMPNTPVRDVSEDLTRLASS
jgi:protein SCO1/2